MKSGVTLLVTPRAKPAFNRDRGFSRWGIPQAATAAGQGERPTDDEAAQSQDTDINRGVGGERAADAEKDGRAHDCDLWWGKDRAKSAEIASCVPCRGEMGHARHGRTLLPNLSATNPAPSDPTIAPRSSVLTTVPCEARERSDRHLSAGREGTLSYS